MEKALKQRLLGGLVLMAGAALFLPLLLDGSGAQLTVAPMPVPPEVPGVEAIAPQLDQQVQAADQSVTAAHEGQTFAPEPQAATPSETEDVAPDAAAREAAAPTPPSPAIVSVEKAASEKALREKTSQQKPPREKAATVIPAPSPVTKPAKVTTTAKDAALPPAWVVQVASLGSRDKADALVQSLRKKNYRAVAHQQGGVWKVVVGPELRKEVAESIRTRLAADPELTLSGWVQAYTP